jgi:lipopolysaccharide export LptBFGC system permease protein LptF
MLITLPLYVLRELGKALVLCLLVYGFLMLGLAAGQIIQDGASVFTLITILPRLFPLVSPMVLPLTIITATLICYGRLAGSNEFIAAQAGGVHPLWLAAPALAVSIIAATVAVYLNADVLTAATASIEKSLVEDTTNILQKRLSKPGSFLFHDLAICRMKREHNKAGIDITLFASGADELDKNPRWDPAYPHQRERIIALDHEPITLEPTGKFTPDGKEMLFLKSNLKDARRYQLGSNEQQATAAMAPPRYPFTPDTSGSITSSRISYWGIGKIVNERRVLHRKIDDLKQKITDFPKDAAAYKQEIKNVKKSISKQTGELHMKLALSFACIAFAVVAIPLGLRMRAQSATIGFAYGVGIALSFFLAVKFCEMRVRQEWLGWWAIWLPNLALLIFGAVMWFRSRRLD